MRARLAKEQDKALLLAVDEPSLPCPVGAGMSPTSSSSATSSKVAAAAETRRAMPGKDE